MIKKQLLSLLLVCSVFFGMFQGTALASETDSPFKDVKTSDWFYDAVQYVYEHELMSGTGDDNFSPNEVTTRGMMVTILYKMDGKPETGISSFTDVPANAWYAAPVAWASENGIVSGYGNGEFGPNDPISREQMVTILYQYAQYKQYDLTLQGSVSAFSDGDQASRYAITPLRWAIGKGVISGIGNNLLDPTGNTERSHVATVMKSFCEKVINGLGGKTLFSFDPSEVVSITVDNGDSKLTQVTITDRGQIEEIVKLVNNFTYTASQNIPPASGCGYHISLKTESGGGGFYFWDSGIKIPDKSGEPGSSINYYGKPGWFDTLVTLADNATDPI